MSLYCFGPPTWPSCTHSILRYYPTITASALDQLLPPENSSEGGRCRKSSFAICWIFNYYRLVENFFALFPASLNIGVYLFQVALLCNETEVAISLSLRLTQSYLMTSHWKEARDILIGCPGVEVTSTCA